jgi:acyl dehydratase
MVDNREEGPGVLTTADAGALSAAHTTVLTSRFTMAYAAGINDTNAAYFDDLRPGGLRVHPGIAFSLQWASRARPDRRPNLRAAPFGVHASTDLRIYRPFRPGEAITTQGQIVQMRQIRPGVFNLDRYRMTASDGTLVAELDYNGITRGATLAGPDVILAAEPERPECPEHAGKPLWERRFAIGLHAGQQYTECAQIYNPIHTEPSVAKAAGLPGVILHGSATKAMALTAVIDQCFGGDATRVTRLYGQLRGMVLMDTEIRVIGVMDEVVDGERRIFFQALNDQGQPAIDHGMVCGKAPSEDA